jgi:hexosaminidase
MKYSYTSVLIFLLSFVLWADGNAQSNSPKFAIIPYPQYLAEGNGSFNVLANTEIIIPVNGWFINEARQLNQLLIKSFGKPLKIGRVYKNKSIIFKYDGAIVSSEGYGLKITPEAIVLTAKEPAGMFRAVETLRQLLPAAIESGTHFNHIELPAVTIADRPAYSWRGMHLDVSRHFFSITYIKKFIDVLALYKMNKLHLHLTDDQGWRIEIKKYPKLTEQGAWRKFNNQDSACMKQANDNPDMVIDPSHIIKKDGVTLYGGFYTQAQLKDLVLYAAERHIDIIPEIDMPGHMMAAINAYPYLTCNDESSWGQLFTKPICPCEESTFEFAENIFSEVMDIFPSKYIHIGGDEVDRSDWGKSAACKVLMEKEGIKDLAGLQSYFINRMEKFFNSKGRKLIGWDEILEGGISPTAMVMYWRSWVPAAPVNAAKNGNQVIMAPGNPLYFDARYDKNSVYNVYHFNPIPKGLTEQEAKSIVGAQAELWTEYIPSESRADYQYMPRMTALAERLWTNGNNNYEDYSKRLQGQYARLDALNINYRLPDLDGIIDSKVFVRTDTVKFKKPSPDMTIRYTADGSLPNASSEILANYVVNKPQQVKVAAFTKNGRRGDVYTIGYKQQDFAEPVPAASSDKGLAVAYYPGSFKGTTGMPEGKPQEVYRVNGVTVPDEVKAPSFGLRYNGFINVPVDGIYTFYFNCDDAGVLKINDQVTVDNDGMHPPVEKSGQAALKKGRHPFQLNFVEGGGGYTLKLTYSLNGSAPASIPDEWFSN